MELRHYVKLRYRSSFTESLTGGGGYPFRGMGPGDPTVEPAPRSGPEIKNGKNSA